MINNSLTTEILLSLLNWIDKIKNDENAALKELYSLYRSDTTAWLGITYKLDEEDALEIFQSTVIIFYDNIVQGKVDNFTTDIKFYLRGIAKNKALELFRTKAKEKQTAADILNSYVLEDLDPTITDDQLLQAERALDELGNPCKDILVKYYYQDQSMEKITEEMGYKNTDTTKNQKYKCLKRLQSIYFNHYSHTSKIGN